MPKTAPETGPDPIHELPGAMPRSGNCLAGIGKYHLMVFLGCWLGGIFDGMDSTLMSVVMPSAIGTLTGSADKVVISGIAAVITSVFLFGWMVGGLLFGMIGDRLGRVKSMVLSILLYAFFTGLSGLAQSWPQLAACRFLTGLGIGGELVSIATFLTEVWPSRSRAVAIGVLITSYQAGVFIAGAINRWIPDWRTAFFIGALPAVLVIFLRLALKESDQWLQARDRRLHSTGNKSVSSRHETLAHWQALFQPRHARALLAGALAFAGLLVGYWASIAWIPLWVQDLVNVSGADALGVTGNEARGNATMFQGIAAMLGCGMAGLFSDWIGRRWTIALSHLGCFLASGLLFLTNTTFSPVVYWQCALLGWFVGLAQASLYIYLPELFPTLVRATGTGFCLNAGRFVTAISVFFVGDLIRLVMANDLARLMFGNPALSAYGVAAFLFALAYLLSVLAGLAGEETRSRPLPE